MFFTRRGDDGTSGLFGTDERFPKDSPVYEALGTLDELVSLVGVCRAQAKDRTDDFDIGKALLEIQECLFIAQAELAGAEKSITQAHIDGLEEGIRTIESHIPSPHTFLIPGETEYSGMLDYARAVSRRAERRLVSAQAMRPVAKTTLSYLNRLSSMLYALARYTARNAGARESAPAYGE